MPNKNAKAIFYQAIERDGELTSFLNEQCDDDPVLRREVEVLIAAHQKAGGFLGGSASVSATQSFPSRPIEQAGTTIGPYKLLQQIGEGGFGVVYLAEQSQPVRRKVALKIIKPGMDTKEVIARFEAERQALAMMDHPNIAKVLDGGTTDSGRPYFVMELVKGIPLTGFCDKNKISTDGRLRLFALVCKAIQHAHNKGVIHRDIKPSNVMVTLHDGEPVPKVIDFGVAKAITSQLTEKTMFTAYGQMIGTPQYMSLEQAEMSGLDIDTRSDVYSLGVLLYELLTGTTPITVESIRGKAYAEMQRMIREDEAQKPSIRLSSLGNASASIAANRDSEAGKLGTLVRGELDWIVMKSLEKNRERRYETATSFAADVERFLNNEAVDACPPSLSYKLSKLARKHRKMLAVAAGFALLLSVSSLVGWYLYIDAQQARELAEASKEQIQTERDAAVLARMEAEQARELAVEEKQNAEREQRRAVSAESNLTNQLYNHSFLLAAQAFGKNDLQRTRELLDESPQELRNWEWKWLSRQLHERFEPMYRPEQDVVFNKFDYSPDGKHLVELTRKGKRNSLVLRNAKTLDEVWSIETGPEVGPSWSPKFTARGNYILIQHADYSEVEQERIVRGVSTKRTLDEAILARDVIHTATGKVVLKLGEGIFVPTLDESQLRFIPGGMNDGEVEIVTYSLSGTNAELVGTSRLALPERRFGQRADFARRFSDDLNRIFIVEVSTEWFSPARVSCWSTVESRFVWEKEIKFPSENLGQKELLVGLDQENGVLVVQPVSVAPGEIVRKHIPASRFDTNSGDVISAFSCPLEDARYHVMSRDGRFIASSNSGRTTVVWDPATGKETGRYLNNSQIGFKPTLRSNALWTEAGRIRLDVENKPFELIGHRGRIISLAFDESGEQLVSTCTDDTLRTWDVERGRELTCTPVRVPRVARTSAGVVAYKSQGGVHIAPLGDPSDSRVLVDSGMAQPLWMRDGQILGMKRNAFVVWDQDSGQPVREFELPRDVLNPFHGELTRLQGTRYDWVTEKDIDYPHGFSFDGTRAIAVGRRGKLIACDLQTGESIPKDLGLSRSAAMRTPIFHPNNNDCVAIVDGRDVHFLDLKEDRKLMRLYGHPAVIVCTTFSPDGSRFYSIDRQGGLAVWNTENGEQLLFLPDAVSSRQPVVAMAVSPDGDTLALADFDRIRLLDVEVVSDEIVAKRALHREAALLVDQCHEQTRLTSRALELIREDTRLTPQVREEAVRIAQTRGDLCFKSAMLVMGPQLRKVSDLVKEKRFDQAAKHFTELVDEAAWIGPGETIGDWNWRASNLARNWGNIDRSLGRQSPEDKVALLDRALEREPNSHALCFVRSEEFANRSDWVACGRVLTKAVELVAIGSPYWHHYQNRLAILNLRTGNLEQYAANCQALFEKAEQNADPELTAAAAIACLLTTKSGHSLEELGQLLEKEASGSDSSPTQSIARSLYKYRTGNYEQSIEHCHATQLASANLLSRSVSVRSGGPVRPSWTSAKYEGWAQSSLTDLLRALCFQKLGRETLANRFLSQADQQKFNNLPFMWPHRFAYEVARQEAADVFGEEAEYTQTSYGWSVAERKPPYDRPFAARDNEVARNGDASGLIIGDRRVRPNKGYSLAQSISAIPYRGKRIQLKGFVRSEGIVRFGGLWMRIDGSRESMPFDNMNDRPIRRTTDWKECSIALDVPEDATSIVFGGQLVGRGKFWMDDLSLEIVDESILTTGQERPPRELSDEQRENQLAVVKSHYREAPINLGFETPMRLLGLGLDVAGEELVVRNVLPNSIAETADFKVGQVILAVDDAEVTTMRSFIDFLHEGGPKKQVSIRADAGEQTIEVVFPF